MNFEWLNQVAEFLSQAGGLLKNAWVWFCKLIPTIDGICLSFITYYTFRLTVFPKKLKFISFKLSGSAFDGDAMEITLENRSLCPTVVESVDLIVGSKKIQFFRGECNIDGFKTGKIEMPRYSQIISADGLIDIDICAMDKISLLVKTTRGIQHIRYETISKMTYRRIQKLEGKFDSTTVCRNYYGDRIVVPGVRYAISYVDHQGEKQIVFIHKSGTMSEAPFGYNGLSDEIMKSEATIRSHFDAEFQKCNLSYDLKVFHEPFATDDIANTPDRKNQEMKEHAKKKNGASATTVTLCFLFMFSLSIIWDIIRCIPSAGQFYRYFPLIQSLFLTGYTWASIATTNDLRVFNRFVEAKSRRKRWIGKLAHWCAAFIFGFPVAIMWGIDVTFNRGSKRESKRYWNDLKRKLADFETKPLIVRTFAVPASIILIVTIPIAIKVLPKNLIPIAQNIIDALVSFIGLTFVLVNSKEKHGA